LSTKPCKKAADELRQAIKEWVRASEATRDYMIKIPWDITDEQDTVPPGYFEEMKAAFEKERQARAKYIKANIALLDCMRRHDLID
jgi:hypothetical protein